MSDQTKANRQALSLDNTFAITTAHQPNLFLGPLYTITKAISTISICRQLNEAQKTYVYVPVYIIGSEDHDKEELLQVQLFGKTYEWQTAQKGPIGSMIIDESLLELLQLFINALGSGAYALELQKIYLDSFQVGRTISQATFSMFHALLGQEGLIVLDLNQKDVKACMKKEFAAELNDHIAIKKTEEAIAFLSSTYKIQASPRDINLFLLQEGERKRIEASNDLLLELLNNQPELFSPNVMLRPLMQQKIVPSVANIGGAAEVSYWMELKALFDHFEVDFPVLIMRDVMLFLDEKSEQRWTQASLNIQDFFISEEDLKKKIARKDSNWIQIKEQALDQLKELYTSMKNQVEPIDKTLVSSIESEWVKSQKSIEFIDHKVLKAEKRKAEELLLQLEKIKAKVFFQNTLIERKENFASYYVRYGLQMFDLMLDESNVFAKKIKILVK
jgi:bacillithiol biosynthesis cysteine-adding enzyme BshC